MSTNSKRFQKHFDQIVRLDMQLKDSFHNVMQLPKLDKIVLNTGLGQKAVLDRKRTVEALFMMELITGQKAYVTRAKKSIDKFKLREKMPIGCKVTLRKHKAFCLLDRLINTALPNVEGFVPLLRKQQPNHSDAISVPEDAASATVAASFLPKKIVHLDRCTSKDAGSQRQISKTSRNL